MVSPGVAICHAMLCRDLELEATGTCYFIDSDDALHTSFGTLIQLTSLITSWLLPSFSYRQRLGLPLLQCLDIGIERELGELASLSIVSQELTYLCISGCLGSNDEVSVNFDAFQVNLVLRCFKMQVQSFHYLE